MNLVTRQIFGFKKNTADLLTGLVAYYLFENNITDSVSSMNGTNSGGSYISGKSGNCINFSSSPQYVAVPDNNNISFTSGGGIDVPFSISLWVLFTSYSTNTNFILSKVGYYTTGNDEWEVQFEGGSVRVRKFDRNSNSRSVYQGVQTIVSSMPSSNVWYHLVITDNGSKTNAGMKVYVNGLAIAVSSLNAGVYTGMNNGTNQLVMGIDSWGASPNRQLRGSLDEVAIWKNRALGQDEVTALYNAGTGKFYPF